MKLRPFDPHETHQMQVLAGAPLASFRSRAAAIMIDVFIGAIFAFVLILLITVIDQAFLHSGPAGESFGQAVLRIMTDTGYAERKPTGEIIVAIDPRKSVFMAIGIAIYFALITYLGNGRTVGKALLRIRTVSLVHDKLTLWQSVERALGYSVSLAEAGFGFIQYFIHPNHRTVHDRIAETIVIKEIRTKAVPKDEKANQEAAA